MINDESLPSTQEGLKEKQSNRPNICEFIHSKSIIKLDNNFHIYVHGKREMIEKGENEKGKYYRLYFEKEQ